MTRLTAELLSSLRERGVRLSVEGDRLICDAPAGVVDEELRAELAARKAELMTLIAESELARSGPRSLVPLKATGDYPPLFARPGHNGDVFCYRALAAHVDQRQPLYGIEPKGVDGSPIPETVEEIAAYEVEQIREFQPSGPYHIAAYCAGGAVAFESARQLAEAGEPVARVLLLGAPFPTTYRTDGGRLHVRSLNDRVRRHARALTAGSLTDAVEYGRGRAVGRWSNAVERSDPAFATRRRVEEATISAVKRFEPKFYPGRIDVFLPNEAWRYSSDQPDEWRRVAGEVVEYVGPDRCDGDDMLREPHVGAFAALLRAALGNEGGKA